MRMSEDAMRETFRETILEIEKSSFLSDLLENATTRIMKCPDLSAVSLEEKVFYAIVTGFAMQRCMQKQFIMDISRDKLQEKMDGYEVLGEEGDKKIILTEKGELQTDEDVIKYAERQFGAMGLKFSSIRRLSEIELQREKKRLLSSMEK